MNDKIIINNVDVSNCPDINTYCQDKPICQKGIYIGGNPSECDANCNYARHLQEEQIKAEIKKLKIENEILKTYSVLYERDKYLQCLKDIKEIVSEPYIPDEKCSTCKSGCMQKDILNKISEVINEK